MVKAPITYNFQPNSLFRGGPNSSLNACVGINGGPYDLLDYGRGFFEGGSLIVAGARENRAPVDIVVYPAAFAFRHGIELLLKALLEGLLIFNGTSALQNKSHGIITYFELVEEQLGIAGVVADPMEIPIARNIIKDFNQIDPTGQVFRYPEDIKGNQHLIGITLINVEVLESIYDHIEL